MTKFLSFRLGAHLSLRENGRGWFCLLAIWSVYPLWHGYMLSPDLNDDAFITLAYAKNLIAGNGFVYNHGPETLGTTSPLQTLLAAGLGLLLPQVSLISIAKAMGSISWVSCGWLVFAFRERLGLSRRDASLIGIAIFALGSPYFLGMETWMYLAILVLACGLAAGGNYLLAGISTGLLFLCRGDGGIIGAILGAQVLLRGWQARRLPWREVLALSAGFLIVVLPWVAYCLEHFGSVIPNTLGTKLVQGEYARRFLPGLLQRAVEWGSFTPGVAWLGIVYHALAVVGAVWLWRGRSLLGLLAAGVLAHTALFTLLGVAYYPWYILPEYFLWQVLIGAGIAAIARRALKREDTEWHGLQAVALAIVIPAVMASGWAVWGIDRRGDYRGEAYREVCDWLNEHAPKEAIVGASDIGYLGYFTGFEILDFNGIVTPRMIEYMKVRGGIDRLPEDLPGFIMVVCELDGRHYFSGDSRFRARYSRALVTGSLVQGRKCKLYALKADAADHAPTPIKRFSPGMFLPDTSTLSEAP